MARKLYKVGIKCSDGETPIYLGKSRGFIPDTMKHTFFPNGTTVEEWDDRKAKLNTLFRHPIANIREEEPDKIIVVTRKKKMKTLVHWQDRLLINDDFTLVLGEGFLGRELINLNNTPHLLIGGESGSGKSIMLKHLIFQSSVKGADVHLSCFKGGVDFPRSWHNRFNIVTEKEDLLTLLTSITDELERRKKLFLEVGCDNLVNYNKQNVGNELKRIIYACDEITDVMEKTGRSKADVEFIGKIEACLSKIARLGRAFGINLMLATQRSSADVLSGQISNNIGLRICGRANSVLSKIILDDTSASKLIPKNAQGRFITNTGQIFQGYWFDDKKCFTDESTEQSVED
jgi:S-DNA-T family DNA segregation ATPase FtsK/SpoIIIE